MRVSFVLIVTGVSLVVAPVQAQSSLTPFDSAKARQLLRTGLACLGCHSLGGEGGRVAVALDSVGARRSAHWIRAAIDDPQGTLPGAAMPRALMPNETRALIVRFLASTGRHRAPTSQGPDTAVAQGPASAAVRVASSTKPDGGALYARWCANCHGASGGGDGPNAPFLPVRPVAHADPRVMRVRPDDALYDAIFAGGAVMGRSARMPAFGATLSPAEIRALVAQIRRLCRCEGPAWSHDPPAR